jgi:hypothetical protein
VYPDAAAGATACVCEQYPPVAARLSVGRVPFSYLQRHFDGELDNSRRIERRPTRICGYDDPAYAWMCAARPVPAAVYDTTPTISAPVFVARKDSSPRQSSDALDRIRRTNPTVRVFDLHVPTPGGVLRVFPPCFDDLLAEFEHNRPAPRHRGLRTPRISNRLRHTRRLTGPPQLAGAPSSRESIGAA